jgi:CRP/FNR family cyclic AMP-dependent transcriptional regulator
MSLSKSVQSMTQAVRTPELKTLARALLSRAIGFRECEALTLDAMAATVRIQRLSKGELLAQRGGAFDALCLVVEGTIEASLTRHDGRRQLTSFLQPGDLVGMISLVDGMGHVNDLRARQKAAVLIIPGDELRRLRELDPKLSRAFEAQLAFRSRLLYERLSADPSFPLDQRLARLLNTLANLYGLPRGEEVILNMKLSQSDMADWLGASRQRVNFVVKQLEAQGLIRIRYSTITIVKPSELMALVKLFG